MINKKIVSVLGGNGFLGKYLVNELLAKGYYVKVISRTATASKAYLPTFRLGQYKLINCDIKNIKKIENQLIGTNYVINLIGLLVNKKNNSFEDVHNLSLKHLVELCNKLGVHKLIHVSAIGAEKDSKSNYAKTKYDGEENIKKFKNHCVIRPSIIYGDEDNFINLFAKMAKMSPFLPLIGGGKNLFQPIWVQDVAKIITNIMEKKIIGKTLDVGGDNIYSFKQILEMILNEIDIKRKFIVLPYSISKKIGFLLENLPLALLTRDQVEMLKKDNIITKKNDYRKIIKYTPHQFKQVIKKQLRYMKKTGGHIIKD